MTILTTTMQLEKPEIGDEMEPYFLGTTPSGSYWTILTRLSEHDHTGGLSGKTLTAATIPDGSITPSKLHPSVYDPLALVDGSKPFTGQVTMQADAVVRDRLSFGEQGTALAPDAWLERAAPGRLRTDSNLGVGVAPAAWDGSLRSLQVGQGGSLMGYASSYNTQWNMNTYYDGVGFKALAVGFGSYLRMDGNALTFANAPSVAAGATQTFTTRLQVAQNGTVTLTPDAGQAAVVTGNLRLSGEGHPLLETLVGAGADLRLKGGSGLVRPDADNANYLGGGAYRWIAVYAVNGTIQTSAAALKEDALPLPEDEAMAAVRATTPVTFDYLPPTRDAEWYELPDDPEQAEAVLYQRLTAAPLEAAARHQAGVILGHPDFPCDPLFETGTGQTNPSNGVGILIAAVKHLDARLQTLEAAAP